MASSLFGRSSGGPLYWVCSSEGKERGRGQGKERGQKVEACRKEEEEKMNGVPPTTPEQDTSKEHWKITDYEI